jgi:hypothetical protein
MDMIFFLEYGVTCARDWGEKTLSPIKKNYRGEEQQGYN